MTREDKASIETMGALFSRLGEALTPDGEHFMNCNDCGEAFDMRDLAQVCAHEHRGICADVAEIASLADDLLADTLRRGR